MSYLWRSALSALLTLVAIMTLTFFLLRVAPGGPFDTDRAFPLEVKQNIERRYLLDLPVHQQFFSWLAKTAQGDLGESFQHIDQKVSEILYDSFWISFQLGIWAFLLALSLGFPLGALSAWYRGRWFDHLATVFIASGITMPSFLVGTLLVLVFSLKLQWLPPALIDEPGALILPIITLSYRPLAIIARMARATTLESLTQDYVRTAQAKGLQPSRIIFKHALSNSLIPVIALLGPIAANLITGSFVVEFIFQLPGMGKHFVSSVMNRDYPLVMGITLFYSFALILSTLLMDVTMAWFDPRLRLSQ